MTLTPSQVNALLGTSATCRRLKIDLPVTRWQLGEALSVDESVINAMIDTVLLHDAIAAVIPTTGLTI
ncbi:hypothetical protein [Bradyrhizobium embrapense]